MTNYLSNSTISNNSRVIARQPGPLGPQIIESYEITKLSAGHYLSMLVLVLVLLNLQKSKIFSRFKKRADKWAGVPPVPTLTVLKNIYKVLSSKDIIRAMETAAREFSTSYPHCYRLRVGYPVVVLTSPQFVEALLSSNEMGHTRKADEYHALADYLDEGLITSSGEKWRARRKLLSPLYNYRCFAHFLEVFNRHSKHLLKELDAMFKDSAEPKPIQTQIYKSMLKIICEIGMQVELNDASEEFDEFFEEADICKNYIFYRISRPWVFNKWIRKFHPFTPEYERNIKAIKDYMLKVIVDARRKYTNEALQPMAKPRDKTVMDVMLENGLSDLDIREEAHTMISAGHETSAAVLQYALQLLAENPEHQIRCQEEIDQIIKDPSKCPNGDFTLQSIADLKYTDRCLKETLRLYPIVHTYGRKITTPLRLDDNIVLPEGTTCVVVATDLHMNPELYPQPEKFDPSRFTPENTANRHSYAYLPFSRGPRMCLGYKFAMTQMTLMLAGILHHFSVSTTDRIEDVPFEPSILIIPARGYNFVLKKRNPLPV